MTKQQKARLGIFLIASFMILLMILGFFIIPKLQEKGNIFLIDFRGTTVNGLYVGSPVKYLGVDIGRVERIMVNPSNINSVLVTINVEKRFSMKRDMTAALVYLGITGQKFVELSGGSNESQILEAHGEIMTRKGLEQKAEDIVSNIDRAVLGISNLLDVQNQERISLFLDNVEKSSTILSDVLEARKESLEESLANIQKASQAFSDVTENLRQVTENLSGIAGSLESSAGAAFDNLNKRFSDEEMGKVLRNLEAFIDTASSSVNKIETMFIHQQEELRNTFENLSQAMDNLSKFSREITEDPTLLLRRRKEKKK
jgi:phospholipid/cholesterol/gamma-HCH transport system substrate-binding protein